VSGNAATNQIKEMGGHGRRRARRHGCRSYIAILCKVGLVLRPLGRTTHGIGDRLACFATLYCLDQSLIDANEALLDIIDGRGKVG
jgi:hypothetical protein